MVETITCLSKEPFPASNYIRLFGQHEQLLNNLCARYEDKLIPDLYRQVEHYTLLKGNASICNIL